MPSEQVSRENNSNYKYYKNYKSIYMTPKGYKEITLYTTRDKHKFVSTNIKQRDISIGNHWSVDNLHSLLAPDC